MMLVETRQETGTRSLYLGTSVDLVVSNALESLPLRIDMY